MYTHTHTNIYIRIHRILLCFLFLYRIITWLWLTNHYKCWATTYKILDLGKIFRNWLKIMKAFVKSRSYLPILGLVEQQQQKACNLDNDRESLLIPVCFGLEYVRTWLIKRIVNHCTAWGGNYLIVWCSDINAINVTVKHASGERFPLSCKQCRLVFILPWMGS